MKIIHVINSLATGGAERLVIELSRHGIVNGHDISIVLLKDTAGLPRQKAEELGISVTVLGNNIWDPRIPLRLRKITQAADIVHVHLFPALYWSAFVCKPKIFTEHSTQNRRFGKRRYRFLERLIYNRYIRVIAISSGVRDSIVRHLSTVGADTKVSIALNGIADEFFVGDRTYSLRPNRMVSIGSLSSVKQHELAIEAVALLEEVSLQIAGDGPLKAALELKIQELRVEDRVKLLGNIADIPGLLRSCDLLISTSKYEGFSLVAAEAQATGIPVVGPDVEGFREVVIDGETGLLFRERTPEVVAKTIVRAIEPNAYMTMAKQTEANAMKFRLGNSFDAQMEIYNEVLEQWDIHNS